MEVRRRVQRPGLPGAVIERSLEQVFAQLFSGAKPRQARFVQEGVTNCTVDMTSSFVRDSVAFTDSDRDGKIEVSFAYDLGCDATERPTPRTLLILEGNAKVAPDQRGPVASQAN